MPRPKCPPGRPTRIATGSSVLGRSMPSPAVGLRHLIGGSVRLLRLPLLGAVLPGTVPLPGTAGTVADAAVFSRLGPPAAYLPAA